MAVTNLIKDAAQSLGLPDLIRRAESGEEIRITEDGRISTVLSPLAKSSLDATIERIRQWERENGQKLCIGFETAGIENDSHRTVSRGRPSAMISAIPVTKSSMHSHFESIAGAVLSL